MILFPWDGVIASGGGKRIVQPHDLRLHVGIQVTGVWLNVIKHQKPVGARLLVGQMWPLAITFP